MNDQDKTREQLIAELVELRQRVAEERATPELKTAAALFQVAPLGIHECDTEGRITFVNPSQEAITGYTAEELVGTYVWDRIVPGPEKDALPAYFKHLVSEQPTPTPFFAKNVRKSGEVFDVRIDWNYIRNAEGEVAGFVSIVSDITEQKRAEDELRRSEARLRSVVDNAPVQVTTVDRAGTILFINRPAPGLTLGDVLGRSVFEFLQPEYCDQARQCIEQVFRTGETVVNESLATGPHGTRSWYETRLGPVSVNGQVVAVTLVSSDITDRRRAEEELRRNEQQFRSIGELNPFGVWECGADGGVVYLSQSFLDMVGMTLEQCRQFGWTDRYHPQHVEKFLNDWRHCREAGAYWDYEHPIRDKDGQYRTVLSRGFPLRNQAGQIIKWVGLNIDITDRKRAEEAIRRSEQRMRLHVEQTPLAVIEWDLELQVSKWNPGAERIFGYTSEEALGRHFAFLVPPKAEEQVDRVWDALRVEKGGERSTNENVTKDGRTILCEWYNTPLVNAESQVVGFASLAEDITERKRMETALRASEAKYRRLHQSMMDAFVSVDMDGRIQEFNDAYRQLLGYEPEELPALRYTNLTPEKWHPFETQIVQEQILARGYSDTYEKEYRRKDGTVFPVELRTFLITDDDGKPAAMWAIVRDITERKKAEECLQDANRLLEQRVLERTAELAQANTLLKVEVEQRRQAEEAIRQSEAKYRALVESCPDAVAMLDLQGQVVFASQRAAEQLGLLHPDELVGRRATEFVVEPDRSRLAASLCSLIEEGVHRSVEYRLVRKDGSTFDAEVSSAVIRDAAGSTEALMGVYRDISERKQAEEKLKREQRALRRMVLATDHERRLITYELHDGVAQQLLGAMMHFQAQEPPADQESKASADAYRGGMDALRQASGELRRVMNRLRTPVLDRFGLAEAIEDVASQLCSSPGAPKIEYSHDVQFKRLEPTLENSLFRIAQEAMTNACRYSKSEKVRVKLTQKGDEVTLEVRDWGIGFDQDMVQENRFGLEGIRERSRLLGGKLSIKSEPGQGTAIRVKFPVIEAPDEE